MEAEEEELLELSQSSQWSGLDHQLHDLSSQWSEDDDDDNDNKTNCSSSNNNNNNNNNSKNSKNNSKNSNINSSSSHCTQTAAASASARASVASAAPAPASNSKPPQQAQRGGQKGGSSVLSAAAAATAPSARAANNYSHLVVFTAHKAGMNSSQSKVKSEHVNQVGVVACMHVRTRVQQMACWPICWLTIIHLLACDRLATTDSCSPSTIVVHLLFLLLFIVELSSFIELACGVLAGISSAGDLRDEQEFCLLCHGQKEGR